MNDHETSRLRRNVVKVTAIRFLINLHLVSAVLVPFFTDWGGLSLSEVFWLNAWFVLCMFLLEVPTGTVADYFGRKVSMAVGSIVLAIGALVYISMPSLPIFMLAEILFAIGATLHSGADEALLYDTLIEVGQTESARARIARLQSASLSGMVLGALLGGFVADAWGLRAPLATYVIPTLMATGLALSLVEPHQSTPTKERRYLAILRSGLSFVRHHPVLLAFGIELALAHGLVRTIIWIYQPLLKLDGLSIAYFGVVHAAAALGQIVFLGSADRVDRLLGSRRRLLVGSGAIAGAGFIGLAISPGLAVTIVLILIVFTFGMSRSSLYSAYIHHFVPSENRATVMSAFSMIRMLAIVLVSVIVGPLADWSLPVTLTAIGIGLLALTALTRIEEDQLVDHAVA